MSTADVGIGGPPAPRWGIALVARLNALAGRLRDGVARLLDPDDSALRTWAAAFAKAPQAVPNLPLPPNRRVTRSVLGVVIAAHLALLAALYWRSSPPPAPRSEMTVELVREMPQAAAKPKPPESKPEPKPPQTPVQQGKSAEHRETTRQQAKQEQQTKPEQHQAKQEPKPEARQPKAARQHQAHRAAPPKAQENAPDQQKAREQQKDEEKPQTQAREQQERPAPGASQAQHETPPAMAAVALPGASDAGTDAVSYQQLVLSQVAKAKKQGRYMGVPGYAGVRFRVAEDGSLEMVKLVVSSGDPNLDIEAEAMIRRAAPFPKPPPGGRRDYGITLVFAAQPAP